MHPLVARFNDSTALFSEHHKTQIESFLTETAKGIGGKSIEEIGMETASNDNDCDWWGEDGSFLAWLRPYTVRDGILFIPVKGVLLHDFPYSFGSYATGYVYIWRAIQRGLADDNVKGIALMIHSPGGQVAGCFDLGDKIVSVRGQKPMRAFCHEYAYSAAYLVASSVDPGGIWVSRTGGVGSIGVVTMHVSYEEALKKMGVEMTYIFAGEHKVEGNPYNKLGEDAKGRIQNDINKLYGMFTSSVARNRDMEENDVRATKALTYMADDAIEIGLADYIGTEEDATVQFAVDLEEGNTTMAYTPKEQEAFNAGRAEGHTAGHTSGFESGKVEGHKAGVEDGKKLGGTEAVEADRKRRSDILGCDEAKDRPKAARALADANVNLDAAKVALAGMDPEPKAAAPGSKEAAPKPGSKEAAAKNFAAAMDDGEHPNAHAEEEGDGEEGASGEAGNKTPSRAQKAMTMAGRTGADKKNHRFGGRPAR